MRKKISIFMAFLLLVLSFSTTSFAQSSTDSNNQIDTLLDKRAELICLNKWDELDSIDMQLESLGVEKLTPAEVEERFCNIDGAAPRVSTPVSNNVTWLSNRTNYTYGGVTYEIQTLTAQPNQNNSNLKVVGNRAIASKNKWSIGIMNGLTVIGSTLAGEIPGATLALTVYDTVSGFVSGISKTTEISSAEILYSYSHTTTASFKYVKIKGQSDDSQVLTYISTNGTTSVGYQYPTFTYSGGAAKPNVIQGNRTVYSTPSGYNSNLNAVKSYTDPYAANRAYVGSVKITGIESKSVSTIYPVCPEFPLHIR